MDRQPQKIPDKIFEHILAVSETGEANMFDIRAVMRVAYDHDLYELVNFLTDKKNKDIYFQFILSGKR